MRRRASGSSGRSSAAGAASSSAPRNVGEGFLQTVEDVGGGLFRGVTGVVTKPLQGAQRGGVEGFFKGVAQGAVRLRGWQAQTLLSSSGRRAHTSAPAAGTARSLCRGPFATLSRGHGLVSRQAELRPSLTRAAMCGRPQRSAATPWRSARCRDGLRHQRHEARRLDLGPRQVGLVVKPVVGVADGLEAMTEGIKNQTEVLQHCTNTSTFPSPE